MSKLLSKLFGRNKEEAKEERQERRVVREDQPDIYNVPSESERMNRGIEKAVLSLPYFMACLKNPREDQKYFSVKAILSEGEKKEHIWLSKPAFDTDGKLYGNVGNEPYYVKSVKLGDRLLVTEEMISDWMIVANGRLVGGYTIRALREGVAAKDLPAFDQQIGNIIKDEGEDHFPADFETPEGAIISIEEAYTEGNVEKVLACKDFLTEARIMIQTKMPNTPLMPDIIQPIAESLETAFVGGLKIDGMPSFKGITRAFPRREHITAEHCVVTEIIYYPDGHKASQKIHTCLTEDGWKVMWPE